MNKYFICSFMVLMLCSILNAFGLPGTARQTNISSEDYAVYSVVINHLFAGGKITFKSQDKIGLLVINDRNITTSRVPGTIRSLDWRRLPGLREDTFHDFLFKNEELQKLKDNFKIGLKRTFVKKDELERLFKDGKNGWEDFYQKFPDSGGYVGLSRVGFDKTRRQALVYLEHNCRDRCGSGHFLMLKKGKKGWEMVKVYRSWGN